MCGIAGWFVSRQSAPDDEVLRTFARAMRHRGPDDHGTFISQEHGVGLGHRRLSIIDLSAASHQPMLALGGQVAIAYNGELYNFRELRRELQSLGESFTTTGDTEVVLRAYLRWGTGAFERMAGMFAVALWDARSETLHLVRDPLGIKPLYWMPFRDGIAFASEARAFQALPGVALGLRDKGVAQYLEFGYVIDNDETIFNDVHKLPPGHRLELRHGRIASSTEYYRPATANAQGHVRFDDRLDQLHVTLDNVVGQHLIADVPVALLLSGGIDSSVIAALAARHTGVETLTMAFQGAALDERGPAREVAAFVRARHQEVFITADQVVKEVVDHAAMFDDLFADWGTVTTRLLFRRARELGYKVVLVGEGADELLGGYDAFDVPKNLGLLARYRLYQRYSGRRHGHCRALFDSVMGSYLQVSDDAFDAIRMFETHRQLPNQYVMKVDKASMAEGVEARTPYLDRRVADLAFETPREMLQRAGENKHLLREMARRHKLLPESITRRTKYGSPLASSWMDTNATIRQLAVERTLVPGSLTERFGLRNAMRQYLLTGKSGQRWPGGISIYRNLAWKLLLLELWGANILATKASSGGLDVPTVVRTATSEPQKIGVEGLVTTIIPVFNRGALLRRAVESVLEQTYRPIEIIIVDDGSTDDTAEVADELAKNHPQLIRVLHQQNGGPGVARQAGIDIARGEFVQFLDSDDRYLPEKTKLLVDALLAKPEADVAYGKFLAVHSDGSRVPDPDHRTGERHTQLFPAILKGRIWHSNNPLYRFRSLASVGRWPRSRQMEDWHYDAMAGAAKLCLTYVDEFVAEQWHHGGDHLGRAWMRDSKAHRERADGFLRIVDLARLAGVNPETPEMQHYCRSLFLESRLASDAGLSHEAKRLFLAARENSRERRWEYYVYGWVASLVGWKFASRIAVNLERWR